MKKRTLTLLEIMIVIFLITLITGAIGYNMRGTLDRGRAFRTNQGKEQLQDLLTICLADNPGEAEKIASQPAEYLKIMGLAKSPKELVKDGWGNQFAISVSQDKSHFTIRSEALEKYKRKMNRTPAASEIADNEEP